jgi:hypothetical protein
MRSHSSTFSSSLSVSSGRAEFAGHARTSLIWCVVALLFSPMPGGWLVDHCPVHIRFPGAAERVASWEEADPHPDVLLLGSSRLGSFVRTGDLGDTTRQLVGNAAPIIFNSTISGGEPITLEFITRHLLAGTSAPPRLVVLETNLDLLARDNLYFKSIITQVMTAADLPNYVGDIVLRQEGVSRLLSSRLTPFFRHRSHLLAWADEAVSRLYSQSAHSVSENQRILERCRDLANKETNVRAPMERRRILQRIAMQHVVISLRHYQLAGATPSAFEATVAMLHARGCAIVLVEPPQGSAYRGFFTRAMQNEFEAFIQRLQRSYGCEFVDYSTRLPDSLFDDSNHGNEAGSAKFTELLAHDVVAPAWRKLEARQENNQAALR